MPVSRFHGRREQGAVAILVALSISSFLLGFAALTVDLGMAYARKADLQSIADRLAVAGATGLPKISDATDQIAQTLVGVCTDSPVPGICPAGGGPPDMSWADNGIPADGEISYFDDPDRDGVFTLGDEVGGGALEAEAVQVRLPPSHVEFGLAAALGVSGVDVHKSATARVGTALGGGVLPIPLQTTDLAIGQFCMTDPNLVPPPPQHRDYPWGNNPWPLVTAAVTFPDGGATVEQGTRVHLELQGPNAFNNRYRNVRVYISNKTTPVLTVSAQNDGKYDFTLPPGTDGDSPIVWVQGRVNLWFGWQSFTSRPATPTITYTGTPDVNPNICEKPQSVDRGVVQVARADGASNQLAKNIRTGPDVELYPFPLVGSLLGSVGDLCAVNNHAPASDCLKIVDGAGTGSQLRSGLLNGSGGNAGRLIGTCGTDGNATDPRGVDATRLVGTSSPLLDSTVAGAGSWSAFTDQILNPDPILNPPVPGWVRSDAVRCPRLVAMPVLDATLTAPVVAMLGGTPISRFVYAWIDSPDSNRGLQTQSGGVRTVRGYIIDPKYLPASVAGSEVVGPYLGSDMPKEALLIHNLGDAGT
jgi:Putative Flp pilus-assembly TadE/G-like